MTAAAEETLQDPATNLRPRKSWLQRWRPALAAATFLLVVLLAWEGVVRLHIWPPYLLPSPFTVLDRLWDGLLDGSVARSVASSMRRMAIGYGVSIVLGVGLGVAIARVKLLEETIGLPVLGLQALPSITWLPLALLWFGLNDKAILFVVLLGSTLAITQASADGVKNIPPLYFRTARNLGASGLSLYLHVVLPASLPHIITGMKLGWSFAWRSLMAAELIFFTPGLGHLLEMGREFNDVSQMLAVMLVIILLGLTFDRLFFLRLERFVQTRWGLSQNE